jgi:osmotically-inducible protein OsmY
MRLDSAIKRDVEAELRWDPSIDATDLAVSVVDGVVTLTGFVRSYRQKREAEAVVKRVAGVVGVVNDIEVRLPIIHRRPDPQIAREAVEEIKKWLPSSAEQIRVVVEDGWVTLEGKVEYNFQREYAESAVRWVRGVKGVTNLIEIEPRAEPGEIKREIEEAFRRSADIDASRITVEVNGGEVVLSGTTRSWAEREEAERASWRAPGVTQVKNEISVSP